LKDTLERHKMKLFLNKFAD